MAQRPDGKPSQTERMTFTRPAAERIAKVVRTVEGGDRDAGPLTFGSRLGGVNQKVFRVATFTGAWSIGSSKTVTYKYATNTPNTAAVNNLFFPITGTTGGDCGIAKDGTAWFLIDVPLATATAIFAGSTAYTTVMNDVSLSASLNTSACTITIGKTLVTASVVIVQSTFTSTFVKLAV